MSMPQCPLRARCKHRSWVGGSPYSLIALPIGGAAALLRSGGVASAKAASGGRGRASSTWQILNLGMRFSNECGVRLNLRRMDRFISMINDPELQIKGKH